MKEEENTKRESFERCRGDLSAIQSEILLLRNNLSHLSSKMEEVTEKISREISEEGVICEQAKGVSASIDDLKGGKEGLLVRLKAIRETEQGIRAKRLNISKRLDDLVKKIVFPQYLFNAFGVFDRHGKLLARTKIDIPVNTNDHSHHLIIEMNTSEFAAD